MLKRVVLLGMLLAILFVQQLALYNFINIQLTFLLLFVYSRVLTFKETTFIITTHLILNTIIFSGTMFVLAPFMFVGYLLIPISVKLIKTDNEYVLGSLGFLLGIVYLWLLIIPTVFILDIPFWIYLIQDIPWQILLGLVNFLTILYLYRPLVRLFQTLEICDKRFCNSEYDNI